MRASCIIFSAACCVHSFMCHGQPPILGLLDPSEQEAPSEYVGVVIAPSVPFCGEKVMNKTPAAGPSASPSEFRLTLTHPVTVLWMDTQVFPLSHSQEKCLTEHSQSCPIDSCVLVCSCVPLVKISGSLVTGYNLPYIIGYFQVTLQICSPTGDEKMENYSFNQFSITEYNIQPRQHPKHRELQGKL